jgi:hypothetical protein
MGHQEDEVAIWPEYPFITRAMIASFVNPVRTEADWVIRRR